MAKKLSHTLVGGRTVAGTGGQTLKIGSKGRLYWMDIDEESLIPLPAWCGERGVFSGGTGDSNVIDYVTIASPGNASDFGDLVLGRGGAGANAGGGRGVIGGGNRGGAYKNEIDYVTIASTGNAQNFGDLTLARGYMNAAGNGVRMLWFGGAGE